MLSASDHSCFRVADHKHGGGAGALVCAVYVVADRCGAGAHTRRRVGVGMCGYACVVFCKCFPRRITVAFVSRGSAQHLEVPAVSCEHV